MADENTILAVFQGGIALAGLLLLFSGFLVSKAAEYETKRGRKYKRLALATLIPILGSLALSWLSIGAEQGNCWLRYHLLTGFKIELVVVAIFGIIGLKSVAS